jgi:uncharacterized DUF497 family protein
MFFAWDEWNIDHIARHGVTREEAEDVVENAAPPWPQQKGDDKLVVWGGTESGRLLQVIFVLKRPDEIDFESLTIDQWAELGGDDWLVYVIHAMDLTPAMKKRYRRRKQ